MNGIMVATAIVLVALASNAAAPDAAKAREKRIGELIAEGQKLRSQKKMDEGKAKIVEAIGLMNEDLAGLKGVERAKALEKVEYAWRGRLAQKKEADEVAAEILAIYREDLKTLTGVEMLARRGDILKYILRSNRMQESDESRAWVAGTREAAKAYVAEIEKLDDEAWKTALGKNPAALLTALNSTEDARRLAIEKIGDRIMSDRAKEGPLASLRAYVGGAAAALADNCTSDDLRAKAAAYYGALGRYRNQGLVLYLTCHDLAGARAAFARGAEKGDKEAAGLLEMISDTPNRQWQLDYAWQELTNWVTRISGRTPARTDYVLGTPIESADAAAFAKRHADDFAKLKDNDGFILAEEGGKVFIVGSKTKGVLNGVYRFLERNSDIIWVRAIESEDGFGTVYTKNPGFKNTVKYLCDVPRYFPRHWSAGSYAPEWRWQARLLNCQPSGIGRNMQSWLFRNECIYNDVEQPASQSIGLGIVDRYKDTDPDIFPLIEGKRATWHDHQLCFMNPKTVELFAREAASLLRATPKRGKRLNLGLGDNWSVCTCEMCLRPITLPDGRVIDKDAPNFRSTQYAHFALGVYERLKKEFPYIEPISAPAYIFTAVPSALKYPGGGGTYCPYIKNHKKPVYDDGANAHWHEMAEGFKKAGMPFSGLYEYYLCDTTPQYYHATMEVMQKDLAYYGDALKEVYLDGGYADGPNGVEVRNTGSVYEASAIEFWVCSRLMWDPTIDVKAARREFCRRAYHGAEKLMGDYYERLAEVYNADPAGCFWNDDAISAAKNYIVEKGLAAWQRETLAKAERAATDPRSKELIRRHRVYMDHIISIAEKAPKRVELHVGKDWTELGPITHCGDVTKTTPGRTRIWMRNDNKVLECKYELKSDRLRKLFDEYKAAGKVGTSQDDAVGFDWCNCVEFFIDGRLREGGSYFHLCTMVNERTHTGFGTSKATEPTPWGVKVEAIDGGVRGIVTWPLASLGIDISKGNKVGMMVTGNGDSWNGGQQHAPTSFQTLVLNMD